MTSDDLFARVTMRPPEECPPTLPHGLPRLDDEFSREDLSRTSQTAMKVSPAGGVSKRAILTVLTGLSAGQTIPLSDSEMSFGRSRDCDVRLMDPGISRRHCRIVPRGRSYTIEDLDSTNGTFVNGERIKRAKLTGGERAQIGPDVVVRLAFEDETEEALARQLYEASTRDPLTRAYTRKFFAERFSAEVAYAQRHKSLLSVVALDLDHFKLINDDYGHPAGDFVLRCTAAEVERLVRTEDVFARCGGEEFMILVRGIKHKNVVVFAERVRETLAKLEMPWEFKRLRVTVSIGVASLHEIAKEAPADKLLTLADERLYRAKRSGRNRTCSS